MVSLNIKCVHLWLSSYHWRLSNYTIDLTSGYRLILWKPSTTVWSSHVATLSFTKDSALVLTNMQLHFLQINFPRSYQLQWSSNNLFFMLATWQPLSIQDKCECNISIWTDHKNYYIMIMHIHYYTRLEECRLLKSWFIPSKEYNTISTHSAWCFYWTITTFNSNFLIWER